MRYEIVIALLIVLIIGSAGTGYFVGSSTQHVTTSLSTVTLPVEGQSASTATSLTTTTMISTALATVYTTLVTTTFLTATTTSRPYVPCSTPIWNESMAGNESSVNASTVFQQTPVLLMHPNTTGYVCVIFQSAWQGNESQFLSNWSPIVNGTYGLERSGIPIDWKCVPYNETVFCSSRYLPHAFIIQRLPSAVVLTGSLDYITVVYAYTAPSNSTGFYDETAPWWGCMGMRMAVGYSASQVNATDFTRPIFLPCPLQPLNPVAEYTTGMNVTYVSLNPLPSA